MSTNLLRAIVTTLALTGASVGQTLASPFYATYQTNAGHVTAFLFDGSVQAGGDVVVVTSTLTTPTVDGVDAPVTGATAQSWSNFLFTDGTLPVLSFSGNAMNFLWANSPFTDGFLFDDATLTGFGGPVYVGGPSFGDAIEPFAPARWSLAPAVVPVPEPGDCDAGSDRPGRAGTAASARASRMTL